MRDGRLSSDHEEREGGARGNSCVAERSAFASGVIGCKPRDVYLTK